MTDEEMVNEIENEVNDRINESSNGGNVSRVITAKRVCDLSKEDENWLVENAKKGNSHEFFEVMLFKNGNHRIKLKNGNKRSVAQKNIETKAGMMTNDQLLMEHVFDLEARLKVMEMKHKKLKKKYKGLKQDIYVDVDEEGGENRRAEEGEAENQVSTNQPEREETKKEEVKKNEVKKAENIFEQRMNEAQNEISTNYSNVPAYMRRQQPLRGWRSRISPE